MAIAPVGYKTQSIDTAVDAEIYLFGLWKRLTLVLDVAAILNRLNIPYLIGGSVASSLMGEMRATEAEAVDIVVDLTIEKVIPLLQSLQPRFYVSENAVQDAIRFKRSFNLIDNESLGKVDIFILKDNPFPQIEFQRRRSQLVRQNPDQMLVLPTPEDIILQKLVCYRMTKNDSQSQWRDVLGVLKLQGDRLDFDYLKKWGVELSLRDLLETAYTESGLSSF